MWACGALHVALVTCAALDCLDSYGRATDADCRCAQAVTCITVLPALLFFYHRCAALRVRLRGRREACVYAVYDTRISFKAQKRHIHPMLRI